MISRNKAQQVSNTRAGREVSKAVFLKIHPNLGTESPLTEASVHIGQMKYFSLFMRQWAFEAIPFPSFPLT